MKKTLTILFVVIFALITTSCAEIEPAIPHSTDNADSPNTIIQSISATEAAGKSVPLDGSVTNIKLGNEIVIDGTGADLSDNIIYINAAGNYSLSGSLSDGQIIINCDKATINLELAGVNITNSSGPAIYSADAKMVNIILKEDCINTLIDGTKYSDAELKATLFCEDSLTITGNGTLNISGNYKHGIASDDYLFIDGGNINILSAATDGLHANDGITINGGNLSIKAGSDAIESELAITIKGGLLNLDADDDGIHAETDLIIEAGTINITRSYEGLEGKNTIIINGGYIRLKCDDDSINAGVNTEINGGYIYADCNGDGLDSNGNMTINGGTVVVFSGNNANGPIDIGDRNATFTINGGTVIATGGNMGISVSNNSTQHSMWINSKLSADTLVNITDSNGNEITTFSLIKSSSLIFYSSDKLSQNTSYNINTGGSHSGSITNSVYSNGVYSTGTLLGNVTMTAKNVSFGQSSGMGGWNDFGMGEGGRRPGR